MGVLALAAAGEVGQSDSDTGKRPESPLRGRSTEKSISGLFFGPIPFLIRIMRMTFDPKFAICTRIIANLKPKVAISYTVFGTTS